jgi:hypothetical protein
MDKLKAFLLLPENVKAYWKALNWGMSFIISYLTFMATSNVEWAIIVLPIAKVLSEMVTRYLNDAYVK